MIWTEYLVRSSDIVKKNRLCMGHTSYTPFQLPSTPQVSQDPSYYSTCQVQSPKLCLSLSLCCLRPPSNWRWVCWLNLDYQPCWCFQFWSSFLDLDRTPCIRVWGQASHEKTGWHNPGAFSPFGKKCWIWQNIYWEESGQINLLPLLFTQKIVSLCHSVGELPSR